MKCRDRWKLGSPIRVRVQEEGQLKTVLPSVIQVGDFVNIIAVVDIAHKRDYNHREVFVSFRPIEIVRLKESTVNVAAEAMGSRGTENGGEGGDGALAVRRTRAYIDEE